MIIGTTEHTHLADYEFISSFGTKAAIREREMANRFDPLLNIIREFYTGLPNRDLNNLPSRPSTCRTINRVQSSFFPKYPANIAKLGTIQLPYTLTKSNKKFLIYDNLPTRNNERIPVFSKANNLSLLFSSPTWLVDGTFKIAPHTFSMCLQFMVTIENTLSHLCIVFLPNKLEASYSAILDAILDYSLSLGIPVTHPTTIIGQTMNRKAQEIGQQRNYLNSKRSRIKNTVTALSA
ncbi:hypothetical protein BB559_002468 [Furculomyces boomerangus]|uniref:MULE transposase domain-containing protein n=1 Tax=Furculomyces boomerangus TaxID=61424 RepID=A0A2T9YV81_9FUNG|nr:hypothetical protein BB559_002468 [Furculomyces boomerangus]